VAHRRTTGLFSFYDYHAAFRRTGKLNKDTIKPGPSRFTAADHKKAAAAIGAPP
jgi:hypothetical protein